MIIPKLSANNRHDRQTADYRALYSKQGSAVCTVNKVQLHVVSNQWIQNNRFN